MVGEPYEDVAAQAVAVDWLAARAEGYHDAPQGVSVVTAGVDVQDDRLEVELVGFGLGDESWSLDYRVLYGDPSGQELWEELDMLLRERVTHESGRPLRIRAACIDSGGHHTVAVYNFVRDKQARSIWACKGASRPSIPPWPRRPVRVGKNRVTPLYLIGVDSLKDALMARLRIEEPGAGFCHFPVGRGLDFYAGLTSERPLRRYHKGAARRVWTKVPGTRNEPLDRRILAMAALEGLKASGLRLAKLSDQCRPAPRRSMAEWSAIFNG
jgi:phage terminase large subunit GpA-like protein